MTTYFLHSGMLIDDLKTWQSSNILEHEQQKKRHSQRNEQHIKSGDCAVQNLPSSRLPSKTQRLQYKKKL